MFSPAILLINNIASNIADYPAILWIFSNNDSNIFSNISESAILPSILPAILSAILLIQQYCQQYWSRSYMSTVSWLMCSSMKAQNKLLNRIKRYLHTVRGSMTIFLRLLRGLRGWRLASITSLPNKKVTADEVGVTLSEIHFLLIDTQLG